MLGVMSTDEHPAAGMTFDQEAATASLGEVPNLATPRDTADDASVALRLLGRGSDS